MRLKRLEIRNYKSLRDVAIEPTPLAVFVGPNAAGKTNLADALDFLGHTYRWDLESAVARKGGYENICYRDTRRSEAPVRFRTITEGSLRRLDLMRLGVHKRKELEDMESAVLDHDFEFKARSRGIQSPFSVISEVISVRSKMNPDEDLVRIVRRGNTSDRGGFHVPVRVSRNALLSGSLLTSLQLKQLRVFQLNPRSCRESGVSIPGPDLDRFGGNLPAVVAHLKKRQIKNFSQILETLRRITPSVEDIETGFTHTKALALFIREKGVRRPWTSEDISDGTIQTIALLVAVFDPRIPLVIIEEPENSIHPWALRNLVEAFRVASENKQILLTTHSPILIDQLKPEEVWVVRKPGTETKIDPLLSLDPSLKEAWGQGKFTLSEYLDSGAVPEAVPAAGL